MTAARRRDEILQTLAGASGPVSAAALTGPDAPANVCNISSLRRAAVMGRASLHAFPQGGTRRRLRPV